MEYIYIVNVAPFYLKNLKTRIKGDFQTFVLGTLNKESLMGSLYSSKNPKKIVLAFLLSFLG